MQIYFFIKYCQGKIAKTLDFVNNSAFLLITQALKPFICGTFVRIEVICIFCISAILRVSATLSRSRFWC
jgi:hypothetical protein